MVETTYYIFYFVILITGITFLQSIMRLLRGYCFCKLTWPSYHVIENCIYNRQAYFHKARTSIFSYSPFAVIRPI